MGSALQYWAYHRRLSLDAQKIKNPDLQVHDVTNPGNHSRIGSVRTESESSTSAVPENRRVSLGQEDSDDDDQECPQNKSKEQEPGKRPRRFSIDFLFGKKTAKQEKEKSKKKRAQSISSSPVDRDTELESRVRELKYPGIHNADFAALYFF